MLVDTHTHLYLPDFEDGGISAVRRAVEAGVGMMLMPNVDKNTVKPLLDLAHAFPDNIRIAMGLHPTEVNSDWETVLNEIPLDNPASVAVGEIGMDLYWSQEYKSEQAEAFRRQCLFAIENHLPVIIHQRDALDATLDVIGSLPSSLSGVFHSFGGTAEDVRRIRQYGDFYFGINGIVTFKNSKLREVLPEIGLDRILLETDSPYLTPVPHRGKRNESAYIPHIAAYIAANLGTTIEAVENQTAINADVLFNLKYT